MGEEIRTWVNEQRSLDLSAIDGNHEHWFTEQDRVSIDRGAEPKGYAAKKRRIVECTATQASGRCCIDYAMCRDK
jgi:hypothetical protein